MYVLLNVPFPEKDSAKAKGARWDPIRKSWYVDDIRNVGIFSKWLEPCNIVCENLYILKKNHTCWKCKRVIEVVMLATDKCYMKDEDYICNNNIQLFTYVGMMPNGLESHMRGALYYPSFSRTVQESYYINHCAHCKQIQGDNFLHEVPQQAFYSKLCYKSNEPIRYTKVNNAFGVSLQAQLPYYDETSASLELIQAHMVNGNENRASLHVTQRLINKLFEHSIREPDISINGV